MHKLSQAHIKHPETSLHLEAKSRCKPRDMKQEKKKEKKWTEETEGNKSGRKKHPAVSKHSVTNKCSGRYLLIREPCNHLSSTSNQMCSQTKCLISSYWQVYYESTSDVNLHQIYEASSNIFVVLKSVSSLTSVHSGWSSHTLQRIVFMIMFPNKIKTDRNEGSCN